MQELDSAPVFQIYTDGGCLPNKRGAWAFVILKEHKIIQEKSGVASNTTCNRMELQASIEALKCLPKSSPAILWTDSRVLLEIVHPKISQWKANNWLRSRGQKVIDLDLVKQLDSEILQRQIEWRWVRAHSGNQHNELCDRLCRHKLGLKL